MATRMSPVAANQSTAGLNQARVSAGYLAGRRSRSLASCELLNSGGMNHLDFLKNFKRKRPGDPTGSLPVIPINGMDEDPEQPTGDDMATIPADQRFDAVI